MFSEVSPVEASAAASIDLLRTRQDLPVLAAHGSRSRSPDPASLRHPFGVSAMSPAQHTSSHQQLQDPAGRSGDSPSAELMQYMYWRSLRQQQTSGQQHEGCLQTEQALSSPCSTRTTSTQPTLARHPQEDLGQHMHAAACRTDGYPARPFSPSIADIQQQLQELQALSDKLAAQIAQAKPSAVQNLWPPQLHSAQATQGSTSPAPSGTSSTAAGKLHHPPAVPSFPDQHAAIGWPGGPSAGTPQDATRPALSTSPVSTGHEHLAACSSAQASFPHLQSTVPSDARDSSTFVPAGQGQQLSQGPQAVHAAAPAAAAVAWPVTDLMAPAQMHTTQQAPVACADASAGPIHSSSTVAPTGSIGASVLSRSEYPSYQCLPGPTATAGVAGSSCAGQPGAFMQAVKDATQVLNRWVGHPADPQGSVTAAAYQPEQPAPAADTGAVRTTCVPVGAPTYVHSSQIDNQPAAPIAQQHLDEAQGQQDKDWQLQQLLLAASMQEKQPPQQQPTSLPGPHGLPAAALAPAQVSSVFDPALGMLGAQQQLEYMMRLQQLQMMQLQLLPAYKPALATALPAAPQLSLYGLPFAGGWAPSHVFAAQQQLAALQLQQQQPFLASAAVRDPSLSTGGLGAGNCPAGGWTGTALTGVAAPVNVTAVPDQFGTSVGIGSAAPHGTANPASSGYGYQGSAALGASSKEGACTPILAGHTLSTGTTTAFEPAVEAIHDVNRTGISTWLSQWMPMRSRRSTCSPAALSARPAAEAGDQQVVPDGSLPAGESPLPPLLQLALYPVTGPLTTTVNASSTMMQLMWSMGQTAASASAWSARSAALACVTLSQYQLLALLCCLAAIASAAQLVASAAAAAVNTGRITLQVADRERRLFAGAAALVAFTHMKQLCMLLATQPLLLMQDRLGALLGSRNNTQTPAQVSLGPAVQPQYAYVSESGTQLAPIDDSTQSMAAESDDHVASRSSSMCAPPPWRLSRGLSGLLGGALGLPVSRQSLNGMRVGSMQPLRQSFTSNSRRCSGPAVSVESSVAARGASPAGLTNAGSTSAFANGINSTAGGPDGTSQEISVYSSAMNTTWPVLERLGATSGEAGCTGIPGLPASLLVVYDSLAMVSGLWAGMWLRVSLLLGLQAPLAACRMWLHAFSTWVHMSAAAAAASTRTVMQLAWMLAQLSLVILGTASAQQAGSVQGSGDRPYKGWFFFGSLRLGGPAATTALSVLQWVWQQCSLVVARQVGMCWPRVCSFLASVPGSNFLAQHGAALSPYAYAAFAALAAGFSSARTWLESVRSQTGLFSRGGMQAIAGQALQLAMLLMAWVLSLFWHAAEGLAGWAAGWLLRDVSPVGQAAVYGSAKMIKGLVMEAGRQSGMLAQQLFEAWRAHRD